jgi:YVTN family beta-propeller protein
MRNRRRARFLIALTLFIAGLMGGVLALRHSPLVGIQPDGGIIVPTGQALTPAGDHIEVSDRPLGMVVNPAGNLLAVVTGSNFNPRSLHLIDVNSKTVKQTISIGSSFVGVDFSATGDRIFVGGGSDNDIKVFKLAADGTFVESAAINIPGSAPSGLKMNGDGTRLYVALNLKNAVAVIDPATGAVLSQIPVGTYPYTTLVSADDSKVYVSNWGGRVPGPGDFTDGLVPVVVDRRTGIPVSGTVSVIDTATNTVVKTINVGLHPCGMALSPDGDRLYVTNANSDTVSVVDTATDAVTKTLSVALGDPGRPSVLGSSPNAVAVSPAGNTLYVANAAENAIAVIDLERGGRDAGDDDRQDHESRQADRRGDGAVSGLIPTGWYPTAVALGATGQLYVASGYGFGSIAPVPAGVEGRSYTDRAGVISILNVPDAEELRSFTNQVRRNNRTLPPGGSDNTEGSHPIPMQLSRRSPIKHVFYIIKENRTYDQVFGDVSRGNGDPSLVQFGREVTPNHHALADQFVLLDNYYGPGDQSALGHRWCLQAYPSTWVHKYGNARNDQNPMLLGPTEAIYDNAKAHGLTVRAYGERGLNTITPPNATWTDIYTDWKNGTTAVRIAARAVIVGLRDIYHPTYPAAESRVPDQYRADIFLKEFAQFEQNGNLPNLVLLLLYDDHTSGTSPGFPTPRASVADNDLALGRIVEAISKSRYWTSSAIFVTEDDSQDGLDHVDGHRSVGLVISPFTKRHRVDSTFYTIINMYRTMEQILGLPPLNQFDLAAEPMFSVFSSKPDSKSFKALPNQIPLDEMNPSLAGLSGLQRELAEFSLTIKSSEPDSSPADVLNRTIWHSVKGYETPYNYGRPITRQHASALSLLQLAGF